MPMPVMMTVRGRVRAPLRLERRLKRGQLRAETAQHVFQHMVAADAQPIADHLYVGMPIAEMPCQLQSLRFARCGDLDQRFRFGHNADNGPVIEHQPVTVPEHRRLRQIEQDPRSVRAIQHHAPTMALVGVEHDAIDNPRGVELSGMNHFDRSLHTQSYQSLTHLSRATVS